MQHNIAMNLWISLLTIDNAIKRKKDNSEKTPYARRKAENQYWMAIILGRHCIKSMQDYEVEITKSKYSSMQKRNHI